MSDERRSETRWRYLDLVLFHTGTIRGEGHIGNVSSSGLFVRTETLPEVGEFVQLRLEHASPPIEIQAEVRWVGPSVPGFGVHIADPPPRYVQLVCAVNSRGNRSATPRVSVMLPVAIESGTLCDEGEMRNISATGALIERTTLPLSVGAPVMITFALKLDHAEADSPSGFEVMGEVVRHTEQGGYAVKFLAVDSRLKQAIGRVASKLQDLPDTLNGRVDDLQKSG